jgi:hypothetical protein
MVHEQFAEEPLNLEVEIHSCNQLTNLANQAVSLGLILGHGYHGGKYEILHWKKALLMSTVEAESYLQELIENNGG